MEPLEDNGLDQSVAQYAPDYSSYEMSYTELCSTLLTALAKAIKNTALYGLSHPVVIDSVHKNMTLIGMILKARKDDSLTISFANDAWLFNDAPVPALTQESQNLNAFLKAHNLTGLTFLNKLQSFELGILCEFLSTPARNRPGSIDEFFAAKGVTNIRSESTHYIKEAGYSRQQQGYRYEPAEEQETRPARAAPQQQPRQAPPAQAPRSAAYAPPARTAASPGTTAQAAQPIRSAAPAPAARPAAAPPPRQAAPAQAARPAAAPPPRQAAPAPATAHTIERATGGAAVAGTGTGRGPAAAPGTGQGSGGSGGHGTGQGSGGSGGTGQGRGGTGQGSGGTGQGRGAVSGSTEQGHCTGSTVDCDAIFGPARPAPRGAAANTPLPKSAMDSIFEPAPAAAAKQEQAAPAEAEKKTEDQQQASALANMSFGGILKGLVESTVKDPRDRVHAYEDAMKMLKETMEQQIAESTRALAAEKEQALKTRSRTEHVLSRVAEGKVIVDKDGRILMMNPVAEEIAGTKLADAVGKHISEHMRPGEHFLTLSKDMDLTGDNPVSGEVDVQGDERMGRALRRSVALLEDDEGRVLGTYTTLPEITKYKEAQKMQEEFLSRITHDLQSPLSSITAALEMLNDGAGQKLDQTENKFLDISIRNSHRLSQMIKGILDFSKLQAGKMDMHPQPSLVAPILAETADGLVPWAKTKGITLSVRPVAEDLCALADPPRIVQVLTNLISNAIKATPEGGTITVAAGPNPAADGGVLFGVRDTGHGIPKENLDKIFKKFVQVASYDTQEGVGLGLVIVKDFIELHGGRVWVDSADGKGTTFYFTLPAAEIRAGAA